MLAIEILLPRFAESIECVMVSRLLCPTANLAMFVMGAGGRAILAQHSRAQPSRTQPYIILITVQRASIYSSSASGMHSRPRHEGTSAELLNPAHSGGRFIRAPLRGSFLAVHSSPVYHPSPRRFPTRLLTSASTKHQYGKHGGTSHRPGLGSTLCVASAAYRCLIRP